MYRNKVDSKYARSQMEKHGWREGAGLGKSEHGMKDIIKVQLRSNRTGVGHDLSKEFTNNWWEDMYNKGAKSLKVENGKDGAVVSIVKEEAKKKKVDKMALLYGRFRKGATLTTSDVGQVEVKHDDGHNDDSSDEDKPKKYLTFEEMYQACEGRTCHRGVRHGHSVSAKLRRVEEQDRAILAGQSPLDVGLPPQQSTHHPSTEGKKKKKKKTKEREDRDEEESPTSKSSEEAVQSKGENSVRDSTPASADCDMEGLERKKKKKSKKQKKEKKEEEEEGGDALSSDAAAASDNTRLTESVAAEEVSKKDKKKKKKKREENLDENHCNGFATKNGEEGNEEKKEKKKRKRRSERENFDENCSDCMEEETDLPCSHELSAKKKKKAKKSDSKGGNSDDTDGEAEKVSKKKRRRKDHE